MNIKRLIKDTFVIQRKAEEFSASVKQNMVEIKKHFDQHNLKELVVESETLGDIELIAKKSERVLIDYFPEKLKENLDAEIYNEIINKTYVVIDMQGLIPLLKQAGISAKDFKKFIRVEEAVDREALKRLYDSGDITRENIKGCFTAKVVKSIKITTSKDG